MRECRTEAFGEAIVLRRKSVLVEYSRYVLNWVELKWAIISLALLGYCLPRILSVARIFILGFTFSALPAAGAKRFLSVLFDSMVLVVC